MPLLGGLIAKIIEFLGASLALFIGKKAAFGTATVAAFSALLAGLFVAVKAAVAGLMGSLPGLPPLAAIGVAMAVPPVASSCLATFVSVWAATALYAWQKDSLSFFVKA